MKTQQLWSRLDPIGRASFPPYSGLRVQMMPFRCEAPHGTLPEFVHGYLPMILEIYKIMPDRMNGVGYLTIDEAVVQAGAHHRRPGLHVDTGGPVANHGAGGGNHGAGGNPYPAPTPRPPADPPGQGNEGWTADHAGSGFVMAASVGCCRGWRQTIVGEIGADGNCESLRGQLDPACEIWLDAHKLYWCSPHAIHETLPMPWSGVRQFFRLSFPSPAPWYANYTPNPLGIKPEGPILPARFRQMAYRPSEPALT